MNVQGINDLFIKTNKQKYWLFWIDSSTIPDSSGVFNWFKKKYANKGFSQAYRMLQYICCMTNSF